MTVTKGTSDVDIRTFDVLSLCSGIGALELGIRLAVPTARTICFVEREAYCCEILASRMEDETLDEAPIWTDLRTFDGEPWRGIVDLVSAGYPCQPFSAAGKRLGAADERHLWPEVARIVGEVQPTWVFCENVDRHLSAGFDVVAGDLQAMGYVVAAGLFTAAEVGAPHRRRRLFFLARLDAGGRWSELADTGRGGEHADESGRSERESRQGQAELEQGGPVVADSSRERRQQISRGSSSDEEADGRAGWNECESYVSNVTVGDGTFVADPTIRSEREPDNSTSALSREDPRSSTGWRSYEIFPPGPDDLDGWSRLLTVMPEIEPAICKLADGSSTRMDELRAIGNGVVPRVAALAFRTLMQAHREHHNSLLP